MKFLSKGEDSQAIVKSKPSLMELKSKETDLIQPESGSGKIISIGAIAFTAFVICNFAAVPAVIPLSVVALAALLSKQIPGTQTIERRDELNLILNACTAKHLSINDLKDEFEKQNLSHQVNEAIEEMLFNCQYVDFPKNCKHVLAGFNSVYCYIEHDENGKVILEILPLHYVYLRLKEWGYNFITPKESLETVVISETATALTDHQAFGIGANTRLNAFDVSPVTTPDIETFDLATALAVAPLEECKSMLLMGEPGVGKGLFVERWKNALLETYPNAILYAVNPKPDAREAHRWNGFKNVLDVTDSATASKALIALRNIESALKARMAQPSDIPFALVLGEYNTLSDLWSNDERNEATKLIKRIARQGRSLRCRLLLELHSPNADELGMTASDRACFTSVALGYKNNQSVLRIASSNNFLFPGLPKGVIEAIQALKGQPIAVALCSEYDRVIHLPTIEVIKPDSTLNLLDASADPFETVEKMNAVETVDTRSEAAKLQALYDASPNEATEETVNTKMVEVFNFIAGFIPNVDDIFTARDLYRSSGASKYGVSKANAAEFLQAMAETSNGRFEFDSKTNNAGDVSAFIKRVK